MRPNCDGLVTGKSFLEQKRSVKARAIRKYIPRMIMTDKTIVACQI